jgi:hyperosmotically inducible periplasmic protein
MKYALLSYMFALLALVGCNEANHPTTNTAPVSTDTTRPTANKDPTAADTTAAKRDNTEVNVRDRSEAAKTPFDQNENKADIEITANIRKRVVDTKMSVNAQNVKIITQDGKVTLRGPVKSEDEKMQIDKIAHEVAGPANVDNQLEVQP